MELEGIYLGRNPRQQLQEQGNCEQFFIVHELVLETK